jgi:hypothetical protein
VAREACGAPSPDRDPCASRLGQIIRTHRSDLQGVLTIIDGWINRCIPFIWTKTVGEILAVVSGKADQ